MEINLNELDIIFISLDENNADNNYDNLLEKAHYAKRSHGVIGFDLAHQTAGNLSESDFTITIDADTIIHENFLDKKIKWEAHYNAISYNSINNINGLMYGNGGIKIWNTEFLKNMKTHELSNNDGIDFCWDENYIQLDECAGWTILNSSPIQAWRVGFREGVKLSLNKGNIISWELLKQNQNRNYQMLKAWLSLGLDVKYGNYAMLGAHMGLIHRLINPNEINIVRDYSKLKNIFNEIENVDNELIEKNKKLNDLLNETIPIFDEDTSKWIKNYTGIYYR